MSIKYDLPDNQITNYQRYQALFLLGTSRTAGETTEMQVLAATPLKPYIITATEFNNSQYYINIKEFGAVSGGIIDNYTAFYNTNASAILAGGGSLHVPVGTYLINSSITIGDSSTKIKLSFPPGALLKPANGVSITLNCEIEAKTQIFDLSLGGTITGTINNDVIHPEWFGAGNDIESSDAIQAAFNLRTVINGTIKFTNGTNYILSKTIYVSKDINIDFNGCTFTLAATNTFNNGFFLYYNIDSAGDTINSNPEITSFIKELYVTVEDETFGVYNGIYICQQVKISKITFQYIDQCIKFHTNYIDRGVVEDIYIGHRGDSSNYAINTGSQGDARQIINIQQGAWEGTVGGDTKLLYIGKSHLMVYVRNLISRVNIDCYSPTLFENIMLSFWGTIKIYGADCKLLNIYSSANGVRKISILPYTYSNNAAKPNIIMENSLFKCAEGIVYKGTEAPIYVEDFNTIRLTNVWSATGTLNTLNISKAMCPIDGIPIYTKYAPYLNGVMISNVKGIDNFSYGGYPTSSVVISAISTSSTTGVWEKGTNGVFYYNLIFYKDIARKIGKFVTSEKSVTITTYGARLDIRSPRDSAGFMRLFRGTVSGTYTEYVDVPMNEDFLIDDGITVNGYFWAAYAGTFATETTELNNAILSAHYRQISASESNVDVITEETALSYGTWQKYDKFGGVALEKIYDGATWVTKWTV